MNEKFTLELLLDNQLTFHNIIHKIYNYFKPNLILIQEITNTNNYTTLIYVMN